MEGPLSFLQVDPACLFLLVLGISLVDFIINKWSCPKGGLSCRPSRSALPAKKNTNCENETPLVRNRGLRHRAKLLASVKRRLDYQF
ncbi:uncharacterized protein LOC26526405 [Drosophila erecta]|uniref:Uncharacterized protein n=1 Tax=Drosophila erecta TaxID=7220 RepID=A0A0Q5VVY3_DROER|nr:uncharacterized protein LOC26526405 [Drosophila erecta]KQS63029.1 uncharacterized protein Dere_GG26581 [Drosophila erecta]